MKVKKLLFRILKYIVIYSLIIAIINYFAFVISGKKFYLPKLRSFISMWIYLEFHITQILKGPYYDPVIIWNYILILIIIPIITLLIFFRKPISNWFKGLKQSSKSSRIARLEQELEELKRKSE